MKRLLVVFVLLSPLFFWVGKELRVAQELLFKLYGFGILMGLLFQETRVRFNKVNLWMGMFGIYSIVLYVLSKCEMGYSILINILVGIIIFFAAQTLKKEDTKHIFQAMIWVCAVNMVYMLLQRFQWDFIYNIKGPNNTILYDAIDMVGLLGLKAVIGMWMSLGLITSLAVLPWIAPILLLPLYAAQCTGALVGLTLGLGFYLFYIKRVLFWIMIPILLIGGGLYIWKIDAPMGMMETRPPMWKLALKDVIYSYGITHPTLGCPLIGCGLDSFRAGKVGYFMRPETKETIRAFKVNDTLVDNQGRRFFNKDGYLYDPDCYVLDYWDSPHNEFVQLFYEMGIIGCVIIGFIIFHLFKEFKNSVKTKELVCLMSLVITFLGMSISQFPLHLARIGYLFPILVGLILVHVNGKDKIHTRN